MEELDHFHGCSHRVGNPQFSVEKLGKARGDQFVIEDLLDLSNEEQEDAVMASREYGGSEAMAEFSSTDSTVTTADPVRQFSGELISRGLADPGLSGDLCEPHDDLAELEWLSNFVEDSFSSEDLQKLHIISATKSASSSASHGDDSSSWPPPPAVPGKARSKRSRAAACNWSSCLLLLSAPANSNSSFDLNGDAIQSSPCKKSAKEPSPAAADGRKCLHCATDKTPQWRMGPLGPKTLCNACGVRYKSGRLVPEYRPAASPTFLISKHSNSHRKVLELRRQNDLLLQPPQFLAPGPAALFDGAPATLAGTEFLNQRRVGADSRHII